MREGFDSVLIQESMLIYTTKTLFICVLPQTIQESYDTQTEKNAYNWDGI